MRIPLTKAWRAFPELDAYDDATCREYMKRAAGGSRWGRFVACPTIAIAMIPFAVVLGTWSGRLLAGLVGQRAWWAAIEWPLVMVYGPLLALIWSLPIIVPMATSDLLIRRQLTRRIRTADCPGCRYSLLGQTIRHDAARRRDMVRCPECGLEIAVGPDGVPRENLMLAGSPVPAEVEAGVMLAVERTLITRFPQLRTIRPEDLDPAVEEIEAGAFRRQVIAVATGIIAAALVLLGVAWAVAEARHAAPLGVRAFVSPTFLLRATLVVGALAGWVVGAWVKRLVRGVLTARVVREVIDASVSAAARR